MSAKKKISNQQLNWMLFECHAHLCLDVLGCPPGRFIGKRLSDWCALKGLDPYNPDHHAPITDAEVSKFLDECKAGKHPISKADKAALKRGRHRLLEQLQAANQKRRESPDGPVYGANTKLTDGADKNV